MTDTTTRTLPSFRELQAEEARRHVADGSLSLATARHYFPEITDWPASDGELTEHQRELVKYLTSPVGNNEAFKYGYLKGAVARALEPGKPKPLDELRRRYNDITAADQYVREHL